LRAHPSLHLAVFASDDRLSAEKSRVLMRRQEVVRQFLVDHGIVRQQVFLASDSAEPALRDALDIIWISER
jgi:hypothetical protein